MLIGLLQIARLSAFLVEGDNRHCSERSVTRLVAVWINSAILIAFWIDSNLLLEHISLFRDGQVRAKNRPGRLFRNDGLRPRSGEKRHSSRPKIWAAGDPWEGKVNRTESDQIVGNSKMVRRKAFRQKNLNFKLFAHAKNFNRLKIIFALLCHFKPK